MRLFCNKIKINFKKAAFSLYNLHMDKTALLNHLTRETAMVWDNLCELYPNLVRFNEPKIRLNPYFWRTAGVCFQEQNVIELAYKFFKSSQNYRDNMFEVILPHEIIHQGDYNLFGDSELICGHGENWQKIMVQYGLPADKCHHMEILRK